MATGIRKRYDFQRGDVASLSGATLTFAEAPDFATLNAGEYVPLIISEGDTREVVHLTAYTAAASTGTVERAQEGTSEGVFTAAAKWTHGPTVNDIATAARWASDWEAGVYYGDNSVVRHSSGLYVSEGLPGSRVPGEALTLTDLASAVLSAPGNYGESAGASQAFELAEDLIIRRVRLSMSSIGSGNAFRVGIATVANPTTEAEWVSSESGLTALESGYLVADLDSDPASLTAGTRYYVVFKRTSGSSSNGMHASETVATTNLTLPEGLLYNGNQSPWAGFYLGFFLDGVGGGVWEPLAPSVTHTHTHTHDDLVASADIDTILKVTQAEYDAIATKDPRTLYIIEG